MSIPLQGFEGAIVIPEGTVERSMTLSTYPPNLVILASILVVKTPMAYNLISYLPLLNAIGVITSTYHQFLKLTTN